MFFYEINVNANKCSDVLIGKYNRIFFSVHHMKIGQKERITSHDASLIKTLFVILILSGMIVV